MKRSNFKVPKYVYRLLVFAIIIAALTILMQVALPAHASPALPFIVLFFFFITLFDLYIVLRDQSQREAKKFVSGYVLSRTVKFMSCILFLLIYFFANKSDRWNFAIAFIIIYFLFSAFEVYIMKKENDQIQKKQNETIAAAKAEAEKDGRTDEK
ncbi:MAG: hypothetical protein J5642_05760 [Bacteroidales bacterium]|nr:hypothetical protein [Bacteroidales bacterium]